MEASLPEADAIVVAAGASRRMGGRDKLLVPVLGRPLLAWTLDALAAARSVRRLIVVAAAERVDELAALSWIRSHEATVVAGGARRQESVAAGVAASDAAVVLVHDGARPLVSADLIDRVAAATAEYGAAVPVLPVTETLRRTSDDRAAGTIDRNGLASAQTPQGIQRDVLLQAYRANPPSADVTFTDEAALLEAQGIPVATVRGEAANVKVTEPGDIERVEALLAWRTGPPRVGIGSDTHTFGPAGGLALGGITIEAAPRLWGHSDGDVALHAVADALLGAAGMGDLGRMFPAGDAATRDIASATLLSRVLQRVADEGWAPVAVDVTIVGARPRLGEGRLESMRRAVAELLGVPPDAVGVKASTGNLLGPEGAGRAISASAVATIVRRRAPR